MNASDLHAAQHAAKTFPRVRRDVDATTDHSIPEDLQPRACQDCGQIDTYQPVLFNGQDIAKGIPFHCQECSEKAEASERRKAVKESAAKQKAIWEETIPEEYRATDLRHPEFSHEAWDAIKGHPYQSRNLGLVGAPGQCKTRFLALFAKRAFQAGLTVGWANTFDLETEGKRLNNHRHYDDAAKTIRHWKTCAVLFLDDLGKSRWTPTLEAILFEILEARYGRQRVTHWSLNPQPCDVAAEITSDLLADALDPEGRAADRNHFAPILSRLQNNTQVIPV